MEYFVARVVVEHVGKPDTPRNPAQRALEATKPEREKQELATFVVTADELDELKKKITNVVEAAL